MRNATLMGAAMQQGAATTDFFDVYTMLHEAWAEDPSWSNPGDGNNITTWRNNGSDAVNFSLSTGGTNPPVFRSSVAALNSKPAIESTNGEKLMEITGASATSISQPNTVVMVVNDTTASGTRVFWDGESARNLCYSDTTNFNLFAGTIQTAGSSVTGALLLVGVYNGASSKLRVNGSETTVSATIGTAAMDGFRLLADFNDGTARVDGHISYTAVYDGDLTADGGFSSWEQNIADYYGITIA